MIFQRKKAAKNHKLFKIQSSYSTYSNTFLYQATRRLKCKYMKNSKQISGKSSAKYNVKASSQQHRIITISTNSTSNHLHNFSINSVNLGNENSFLVLSQTINDKKKRFISLITLHFKPTINNITFVCSVS